MRDIALFQLALGLTPPWRVSAAEFDPEQKRLDIKIDFPRGSTFVCPGCGQSGVKAYDTEEKTWRHLNFFQHEAHLSARVPRIHCSTCGVRLVEVPWARAGSGFTLLFEAMIMVLAKSMPIKTVAAFVNVHDTRLWRVLHHYVDEARRKADHSGVRHVGVDETSSKRGHNYVSLFVDLKGPRVLFVTEGKDASTVGRFKQDLTDHGGDPGAIEEVCCDMSQAFVSGFEQYFPQAKITFDKFHIMKIINDAVDQVRREEYKERPELARTRYLWLKNPSKLKASQPETLAGLTVKDLNLKTSRAYHIRLNFQELFEQPPDLAEGFLRKWYFWVTHSRLEGINSLVQVPPKARARGYRTTRNLITMIYLIGGKLTFNLPT